MGADGQLRIVEVADVGPDAILRHDAERADPSLAFALARLSNDDHSPRRSACSARVVRQEYASAIAIQRAAATAPDWSSGTRIGEALKTFNDRYGRRGMARGAVVVILSDGWERADPALVGREMERLARLAHRIVWVNLRAGAPGFEPRAGGMAAALPHCDALIGGRDLNAMDALADAIAAEEITRPEPRAHARARCGRAVLGERRADRRAAARPDAERLRPQARQDDAVSRPASDRVWWRG